MQIVDAQIHTWGTGLPSNLSHRQVTHFTPEEAIALMDEGGVDAAVIHPPGWDPNSTDMAFAGGAGLSGPVRDHGCAAARPAGIARAHRGLARPAGHARPALRVPARSRRGSGWPTARIDWLWAEAEKAGVPIATLATDSLTELGRIAERHPGLRLTIDHLGGRGGLTTLKDAAAMTHMPELLALAKFPNVAVKATGAPGYSGEAYPYPGDADVSAADLRRIRSAPHVLGHRHHQDAVLLAAMRDDVHRGTAVAQRRRTSDSSWARRCAPGGAGTGA